MEQKRLSIGDIVIGEPLLWDVYGEGRKLLMSKGHVVETALQIEILMERGLYIDAHYVVPSSFVVPTPLMRSRQDSPAHKQEIPSVLRLINSAIRRLERVLYNLQNETEAPSKVLEIAKDVITATGLNSDIALGCILLNQAAGHYAVRHCIDTAIVSVLIARTLKTEPDEILTLVAASLTMNVGMLRHQDQFQIKRDRLTEKETEVIKRHPQEGVTLLQQAGINNEAWLSHVLLHHENENGSGYPLGKTTQGIPQSTKILALADHYCACISSRQYRKTLLPSAALREVLFVGGKASDPLLAAYFVREIGTYPPGTCVRLQNGEIGVVTGKGPAPATPIVHALIGPRGAPLSFPILRDTTKELYVVKEPLLEDPAALRFSMHQLWGDEANL